MTQLHDEAEELPILSQERVLKSYVWDVVRERFEYAGTELTRDFVEHPGAAGVVALDENDRVLLIQQYRHPIRHRDWELPAGLLDIPGEDPQQAAARELAEEAGLAAEKYEHLVSLWTTPGGNSEIVHIYLAQQLSEIQSDFVREGEEADMPQAWVPLPELVTAILAGQMRNALLVSGVLALWAKRQHPES